MSDVCTELTIHIIHHPLFHRISPSEVHGTEWFLSGLYQQPFSLTGWERPTEHSTISVNCYAECEPLRMQTLAIEYYYLG